MRETAANSHAVAAQGKLSNMKLRVILLVAIHLTTLAANILLPNTYTQLASIAVDIVTVALILHWWPAQQTKDRGIIIKFRHTSDHTKIWLKTRHGETLQARLTTAYFRKQNLDRLDYIVIDRSVNRADSGQQYIQIINLRKIDQKRN